MLKEIFRQVKETKGKQTLTKVYDSYFNELQKTILMLVFTMANLAKVSPKRLATMFAKGKIQDYANKFHLELEKIEVQNSKDLAVALNGDKKKKD